MTKRLTSPKWRQLAAKIRPAKAAGAIHAFTDFLLKLADGQPDSWIYSNLSETLVHVASNSAGRLYTEPFFEKVLKSSKATAWVFSEDKTAARALRFLAEHNRRVPDDISVVGFENWREAHVQQMSTYDFNTLGMVQQALLMIANEKSLKKAPPIQEVDGYVIERRTTGR